MMLFLSLLFVKHYVVDFVLQTDEMVKGKGVYGDPIGFLHSLQHAIGTLVISLYFWVWPWAIALAVFDLITHYHIDWVKMNYGNRDITNKLFWNHLGLDQLAHQLVYILMVVV